MNSVKISKYLLIIIFFCQGHRHHLLLYWKVKWVYRYGDSPVYFSIFIICHIFNKIKSIFRSTEENLRYSLSILCPRVQTSHQEQCSTIELLTIYLQF
jgi:hypothetical protein